MTTNSDPAGLRLANDGVWEMPEPVGFHSGQLFERATQFLAAFDLLSSAQSIKLPYAAYSNLQHAVELFFKAYLAAQGLAKSDLRKHPLRHDLDKLFDLCKQRGAPVTLNLEYLARDLQENSKQHDFRYPTGYNLRVPSRQLVVEAVEPFRAAIQPIVAKAALEAQLRFASDTEHLRGSKIRWSD